MHCSVHGKDHVKVINPIIESCTVHVVVLCSLYAHTSKILHTSICLAI